MDTDIWEENDEFIKFSYNTAWSTADGIIVKLGELFPALCFTCKYADEDFGSNTGEYKVHDKEFEQTVCFEEYCKESQEFAAEVLGYSLGSDGEYIYDEEKGVYVWNEDAE